MKLEFLTQNDAIYILPFFQEFVRHYSTEFRIGRIVVSPVMGRRSRAQMARELLCLYGRAGFARLVSRQLCYRCLGWIPRTADSSRFYSLRQLCRAHGIEYEEIRDPNDPGFVANMEARQPDVLVSVACPFILKRPLLSIPRFGCVNIHHAPLPRYKGMMPTFWQMYHGETSVGVTVHYMVPELDAGDALVQESLTIDKGESLDSIILRSKRHGAHCVAKALRKIADGHAAPIPLGSAEASYFTFPKIIEIREFHRKGLRAI